MANPWTSVAECVPEITSSRCVTITDITATLNFEVTNYPQLGMILRGQFIRSHIFRAGGYDWAINFYPNGLNFGCAGYSSAFLCYLSQANDVSARLTLNVQGEEGQAPFGPRAHTFSPATYDCGSYRFIERSKLNLLSSIGGGCFTIQCILTIQRNEPAPPPPELLPDHLERLLADGTGADVTFGVGGREFRAHRCNLAARSPVFHAQFFGPCSMMGKDMLRVEVVGVEPAIFEMLLRYIYTDSLPPCDDEGGYNVAVMQHLLVAAVTYRMDRLKLRCEEQLCDKIDMDTFTTMFALANKHDCKQLKDACLSFMASPEVLGSFLETDGFKEYFMANCHPLPLDGGS